MAQSFLGSGDLYFDRLTAAGVQQGYKIAGACTRFQIFTESETKEQTGRGRTTYGQVIASATLPGKTTVSVTLDQLDAENLALAFLGSDQAYTQTAATDATGTLTAIADRYAEIGAEQISNLVVKDATDTTTYVDGTDYEVNSRLGLLKVLSTGAIADGATLNLTYDKAAISARQITGSTDSIIRVRMVLDGKNHVDGSNVKVTVYDARLKPTTAIDFLSEDFLPLELEGTAEIPTGQTRAFDVVTDYA